MRVFRDIDQHRSRTTGTRHIKRLADRPCHFTGVRHQVIVLGDGKRHPRDIGFLKGIGTDQLAAHLPGDADNRRGIQHGGGDSRDHVGRARPGGGNGDPDLPGGTRVSVRHVRGPLLVAHQDMMNLAVLQSVVCRENRAAGIPEHVLHPFALDALPKNARAGHGFTRGWLLHTILPAPQKQNPPSQRFWRGGIREPLRCSVSQLTASLHTGGVTKPRTRNPTTQIRCRS